jgi:L-threonylcarbamoyladenylate synthase
MLRCVDHNVKTAAEIIRKGGIAAFPTETVYGLGANAFDANAVRRIYAAKGRPGDNPLILHVSGMETARTLTTTLSAAAEMLIQRFWPGPLTLVLAKSLALPSWVGGHPDGVIETVAVRSPSNEIARALIADSGCVIAAPSANKSGRPSPTNLSHVLEDFSSFNYDGSDIFFLDGGNSTVGLESTVIDVTGEAPVILRPGTITIEELIENTRNEFSEKSGEKLRSPGTKYKHYAPHAEMTILSGERKKIFEYILNRKEKKIGAFVHEKTLAFFRDAPSSIKILSMGGDEKIIAQNFFSRLREFDEMEVDIIFAEAVHESGIGIAIMDRMRKAAEGRILHV